MNCDLARKQIIEGLSHFGPPGKDDPVMAHVKRCELCRHFYEDALLGHALAEMPVPEPAAGFAGKAVSTAVRHGRVKRKKSIIAMSAAAAVFLFAAVFAWQISDFSGFNGTETRNATVMQDASEKTIRVVIEAAEDRKGATLAIELAENVGLKNHLSERRVEWQTDLVKGKNLLALPLLIHKKADGDAADGYVNLRYRFNGEEQEVHIPVSVESKRT